MIDNGEAYLTYTSLSDKSEKSTIGNVERITVRRTAVIPQTAQMLQI